MKSEIKNRFNTTQSRYSQLQTSRINGKIVLHFADINNYDDSVHFHLNGNDVRNMLAHLLLNDPKPIPKLHSLFRQYPNMHRMLTECLLTFDTEAGGKTMDLKPDHNANP
jgi:hypothetical protein